ncbi:hypothetical protein HGH93_08395, partial [Chitinophaga polysaccharea]|uniref:hypothetical protein n=1 Tax=Chitinophaga polysaccharea TaxID=1293035 RepID=UPI001455D7A8
MKRLLTFLYLLTGLIFLGKEAEAQTEPATGTPFMNLPDTTCWKSFASMNAFYWKSSNTPDSATWTITPGGSSITILYSSDPINKLVRQKPDPTYKRNALTIKFNDIGQYTISVDLWYRGVKSTVTKKIYSKDCSILPCQGKNTGLGDFKENFGNFPNGATTSKSSSYVTGYIYNPLPLVSPYTMDDNSYTVFWNTQVRSEWVSMTDHTGSTVDSVGGMLIANSSYDARSFFTRDNVPVCPGSLYNFSAWFLNVNGIKVFNSSCISGNWDGYHYAGVSFLIINTKGGAPSSTWDTLARFKTFDVSMNLSGPQWQMYGGGFKTPGGVTSVRLEIVNDRPGGCGNDIAVDDISFAYCSPYIYSYIDGKLGLRADSLCDGAPVTMKASYSPNGWQPDGTYDATKDYFKNPQYQWFWSNDGLAWDTLRDGSGITGTMTSSVVFAPGALKGDPNQIVTKYYRVNILEKGNLGNCAAPSEYTKITILPKPKVTVSSGRICIGDSVTMTANGGYSEYEWQVTPVVTGPVMVVYPTVTTTYSAIGIADYGWDAVKMEQRQCRDTGSAQVIVDAQPVTKISGGPTDICLGQQIKLNVTNSGAPPDSLAWSWKYNTTTIGNPNDASITHTPATVGTQNYSVLLTNKTCTAVDTFKVNVRSLPKADTAITYKQCNIPDFAVTRTALPTDQQGKWLVYRDTQNNTGGITFTNPTSNNTTVKGIPIADTVTVIWVITNKSLAACTDTSWVTLINTKPLTPSVAGADQVQCGNTAFQLGASRPGPGETGKWTLGTGTTSAMVKISDSTAYNAIATILTGTRPQTVQLVWTISNGVCPNPVSTNVNLTVKNSPVVSLNAAAVCNTVSSFAVAYSGLTGTIKTYEIVAAPTRPMPNFTKVTGTWSGTTASGSFNVALPANTPAGSYDFIFTGKEDTLHGCTVTVPFSLSVEKPSTNPTSINASVVSFCVKGDVRLTVVGGSLGVDSTGTPATWKWYTGACPGSPGSVRVYPDISNADSSSVTFNNVTTTTTFYVMAPSTGPCGSTTCASVQVKVYVEPNRANASTNQSACERTTDFQLNGNATGVAGVNGLWTTLNPNAIITNPTQPNATVKVNIGDTATLIWTISNGPCVATSGSMFITNFKKPAPANANVDQKHCNDSIFTMAANKPTEYGAYGAWTIVGGKQSWINITDTSLNNTQVKVLAGHTATLVWTITNGTCPATTDTVLLTNYDIPAIANAGGNQKHCNDSIFTMAANKPTEYGAYGAWTIAGGKQTWITITDTTLNTTKVKVLAGHTATLVWTITNGTCAATTDTVLLTNYDVPAIANANIDQKHCNDSIFTMAANKPTEYGAYGAWTIAGGKQAWITITDTTLNTTKVKVLAGHTATLVWTITNGTCAATTDTVLLTNYDKPAIANANIDQKHCNDSIFTMAANKPTEYGAYGAWTIVGGKQSWITITDTTLNTTKVKVLAGHTAALVWTITNGTCAATTDTVLLTNYDVPAIANAGGNQKHCNDSIFTMAANKPTEYGAYGAWTIVGGKQSWITITDTTLNTTKVKVLAGHTAALVWTITNGTCTATTDTVLLTNYDKPAIANAGGNQNHCNDSIFTMAANKPTEYGAYGAWTIVGGKQSWITITDTTLNTTKVKVLAGHTAALVWTITNGTCAATTDTILLTNYDKPAIANAGSNQKHCNDSIFTMAANKPTEYGAYGAWTIVGGKQTWITITDTTLNTTKVKVLAGHTATLVWTITNGTCAATTDTVLLTNYDVPAIANANIDQKHCNDSIFTMAANKPTEYGAYGAWTIAGGKQAWITITDTTLNTTKVKVLAGHTATLVWTITNGTCAATTDTVLLTNYDKPAIANANIDQKHCNDSIFTMAANKPTEYGAYGAWTIVGGKQSWITITDTTLNTTKVKVLAGHTAALIWTITNGTCTATTDTVLLTNYDVPAIANANVDQKHCNDSIFTMAANKPTEYGAYGAWTIVGGKQSWITITDTTLNTTKVKVLAGHTAALVWTVTNGTCAATTDTVLLTNYDKPAIANANIDQKHCNDSIFTMAANKPTEYGAYGAWTIVGGKQTWITITDTTLNTTKVKVLAGHTAALVWTITNGTCAATTDTVLLTNYDKPAIANAGSNQKHCNDSIFTMAANKPTEYGAYGAWTIVGGKQTWITITDTTLNTTKVKVLAGHTAALVWTITNGTCAATTDTVLLTNYDIPAVAKANIDQKHCNDSIFTMAANKPTEYGAYGAWTIAGGKQAWITITDTTLNTTKVKVLAGHTATLVWTITNGTCAATTDTVLLTNYDKPAIANANIDQKHCNDSIFTMAANKPTEYGAYGAWTIVGGKQSWITITDTTLNTTKVKVLAGHTAALVWTITNGTCAATTDTVLLTNYDVPAIANANVDQKHCNDSIFTMAANKPTEYGAYGAWTIVGGKQTWITITDTSLNTTKVKVLAGHTAALVWTITNGTCAATTDTVLLTNYDKPAIANADSNQNHCNDSIFTMAANKPTEYGAYGAWTIVGGKQTWITITDTTLNTTKVKVL